MAFSDGHLKQLGRVVVNFSNLEFIAMAIAGGFVSNNQQVALIVTAEASFKARLNMVSSFARLLITDVVLRDRILDLVKRADAAEQNRNALFHSAYMTGDDGSPGTLKITAKRDGLRTKTGPTGEADARATADSIKGVTNECLKLIPELNKVTGFRIPTSAGSPNPAPG